jgi:RNA polymerase sigma-70 factor (ECF subfamily)
MLLPKNYPYSLRLEEKCGLTHYFVSFTDGQAIPRETEVSRPVFIEFIRLFRTERNLQRWDERHIEQSELLEGTLLRRVLHPPKSVEEVVFDSERNESLRLAIQLLTETQRRRFVLHHEFGLTYEQIGDIEGRHYTSIGESILKAERKIYEIMKKFEN